MGLKAYYDGSGKSDDPGCRFLTLAGYSAQDHTWKSLEGEWVSLLRDKHKVVHPDGLSYWHMSDAWQLNDPFSKKLGWSKERMRVVVDDLIVLIGRYRNIGKTTDLHGFSCTVDLSAYQKVKAAYPKLKPAESLCVDWCTGLQFYREPSPSPAYLQFYFDQNERFSHKIRSVWSRKRGGRAWFSQYVQSITNANMRYTPGIQVGDLLGWVENRRYVDPTCPAGRIWRIGLIFGSTLWHKFYDEQALLAVAQKGYGNENPVQDGDGVHPNNEGAVPSAES